MARFSCLVIIACFGRDCKSFASSPSQALTRQLPKGGAKTQKSPAGGFPAGLWMLMEWGNQDWQAVMRLIL